MKSGEFKNVENLYVTRFRKVRRIRNILLSILLVLAIIIPIYNFVTELIILPVPALLRLENTFVCILLLVAVESYDTICAKRAVSSLGKTKDISEALLLEIHKDN